MLRAIARSTAVVLLTFSIVQCSSETDTPPTPTAVVVPPPKAPAPTIVVSGDTMSATAISGAAAITREIEITAGTTTPVSGLVASVESAASGWISATVSAASAPAKLAITFTPTAMTAGTYDAVIRLTATGAEAKAVRASLVVKPKPRLALDKSAIAFAANLGDTVATQTIAIASVDGSIDSLSVAKPDCGTPSPWVTATLSGSKAPATMVLKATPESLVAGSYSCTIDVSTSQALVDSARQTVRATLSLKAVPKLAVSSDTVRAGAIRTFDAAASVVTITNAGTGALSQLTIGTMAYGAPATGWLTATLDRTTAPATLTLRPTARSLAAGTYVATMTVGSTLDGIAPKTIVVVFGVLPIPSALLAQPVKVNLTKRVNDALSLRMTGTVTHSGDNPIQYMGFGGTDYWVFPSGGWLRVQPSMLCGAAPFYQTPCQLTFDITAEAGSPVGTYTFVVPYVSYYTTPPPAYLATTTFTLTVTP